MAAETKVVEFVKTYEIMQIRRIWHQDNAYTREQIDKWFENKGEPVLAKLREENPELIKELGYE